MKVSVEELKQLPNQRLMVAFNEKLEEGNAVKPVVGEISVSYAPSGVRLTGQVKTLLKLECDTCLRPYFQQVSIDLDEKFVPASYLPDDHDIKERELHSNDFFEPLPEDGVLDISDVVYQAVTLATPTYPSCGSECPGPPAKEGAAQNRAVVGNSGPKSDVSPGGNGEAPIDPRWKNLKTLFPNEDSQQNS